MKIICTALLLLSATSSFAQRFDLSVFGGGAWNSPLSTGQRIEPDAGKINALAAAELRYHPVPKLTVGLGVSVEKLSTGIKTFTTTAEHPEIGIPSKISCNLGNPALTAYLIAGMRFSVGKYSIAPELTAGYVSTAAKSSSDIKEINYSKGSGTMMGLQLSAGKHISKKLNLGIRTGVKYYAIEHEGEGPFARSKTLSVPFGIVAGLLL